MNEKDINERCQKLNDHVNRLKNKEINRLNDVRNNTSDIIMIFESNKDYFKHYIKDVIFCNQHSKLIDCLECNSGIGKGTYDEKALKRILFFNCIFSIKNLFHFFVTFTIICSVIFTYLFYYYLYSINVLSFYHVVVLFLIGFNSFSFILYLILSNSYIRFFRIKEPHLWN